MRMALMAWLGAVTLGLMAVNANAKRIAEPPPVALRVAQADAVFVGKVTEVDTKPKGLTGDGRDLHLATLVVSADLQGRVGKNIEVAYYPEGGRRFGFGGPAPAKGDEVLFFARRHPTRKNTYVAEMFEATINARDNGGFKGQVAEAKAAAALLSDPMKGLKAKDAADRAFAAVLLVTRYKTAASGAKTETVPAAESKLILEALADADWKGGGRGGYQMHPQNVFHQLGMTAADGWTPPKNFATFQDDAKKWLRENAGKFKLTRFVRPDTGTSAEP